jgi:hypothetical protein
MAQLNERIQTAICRSTKRQKSKKTFIQIKFQLSLQIKLK